MPGLSKKLALESMEHYQGLIDYYLKHIKVNTELIESGEISGRKKKALEDIMEIEKKEIQKLRERIKKILND